MRRALTKNRRPDERGAALVEFALILPVFMMLVLGMFSGGLAYNQKLSLTGASREASRYAATLASSSSGGCGAVGSNAWLDCVVSVAVSSATGEMDSDVAGRNICVAYTADGTNWEATHVVGSGDATYTPDAPCYTDGLSDKRVQVVLQRAGDIELLFTSIDLTLQGRSTNRVEAS